MNSEKNKKYLISIAIGPVQEFIASARRSRDLWFGSWLLSEISETVARTIGEENLIFPSNLDGNVVNKILAIVENPNILEADCRNAIDKRLEEIYKPVFDKITAALKREFPEPDKIFYRTKAESQIKDMTELYWTAIPYDEDKDDYKIYRERVEILLNARKSTRDFKSSSLWAGNVPKSSLDGQRESVIDEKAFDNLTTKRLREIFGIREKERLCGVGLLKRLGNAKDENGNKIDGFFSTSHIAAQPLLQILEDNDENKENVRELIEAVKQELDLSEKDLGIVPFHFPYKTHPVFSRRRDEKLIGYDGHLLFGNRLKDFIDEQKNKEENKKSLREAKKAVSDFLKKSLKGTTPNPYYALLLADGDNMGKSIDNLDSKERHQKLSKKLSAFAEKVSEIVITKCSGSLIYAGGDDVLALLPLHTVLDCAEQLAAIFKEDLENFEFTDERIKQNIKPTLSVGVAVYHHTEPLQDALATMRRAEKEAKAVKGKNALAIISSKRSGADTTIKGGWKNDRDTEKSFDERLKMFIQLHLDDALPDGVGYELRDLWLRFQDLEKGTVLSGYEKMLKAETIRILKRKKSEGGKKNIDEKVFKDLEKLVGKISLIDRDEEKAKWTLLDLSNEIIVARDFARAYRQADKQAIKGETK